MVSGRRGDGERTGLDWTADYVGDPWRLEIGEGGGCGWMKQEAMLTVCSLQPACDGVSGKGGGEGKWEWEWKLFRGEANDPMI